MNIAEIKSTSTGDVIAQAEAAHYMIRHNEWLTRVPWTDPADLVYSLGVGGPKPGLLLNLFPVTGTDRNPAGLFRPSRAALALPQGKKTRWIQIWNHK